jgi:predicted peptidase
MLGGLLSAVPTDGGGQAGVESRTVRIGADAYSYQVHVPSKLRSERDLPVIVFLHGINERGTGGFVPTEGAAGALVRHYLEQIPAIVLLPQCRPTSYWSDPSMEQMVTGALDQTVAEFGADARRLYLLGVSMGGYGVWNVAAHQTGRFAAIVSICGGSPLRTGDRFTPIARKVGKTPSWLFHGAEDRVVPASESRQMVEALRGAGADVRYSEYPGVGHNVWMKVLAEKELMPWLLSQRLV